jgi:hypothetical protein
MNADLTTQTQNQIVLAYLQTGASLTRLEALTKLRAGIELPGRIFALRQDGHNIKTEWVKGPDGGRKCWARYTLIPPAPKPVQGGLSLEEGQQ